MALVTARDLPPRIASFRPAVQGQPFGAVRDPGELPSAPTALAVDAPGSRARAGTVGRTEVRGELPGVSRVTALDQACAGALARSRARMGLDVKQSAEPSPREAAKRLRRRIRRYLELAVGRDSCAETGCRSPARFWCGRCDKHALARTVGGAWMSPELYELAWSEFFKTASDESLGERESARERSPGLLPAFPSVSWDRFRRGPDAGDQCDDDEPEPEQGELESRLARLASYAQQAFGDEAGDE